MCCLKARAKNTFDIEDAKGFLEDVSKVVMRQKLPSGSVGSAALGTLAVMDEEHNPIPFPDIAKHLEIIASPSMVERIMHNHHKIY